MPNIHYKPCLGKLIKMLIYDLSIFFIQVCIPFIKHDNRTLVVLSNFLNLLDELLSCWTSMDFVCFVIEIQIVLGR